MDFREKKEEMSPVKAPTNLLCEYSSNPLGIDVTSPRFSWVLGHSKRGQLQSAYQVLVAEKRANLDTENGDKWDSGKVDLGQSINVIYKGSFLESKKTYYWKMRFWDKEGKVSPWSKTATFEMGLLNPDDWKGKWIEGKSYGESIFSDPVQETQKMPYGYLFRKEFSINKGMARARVYVSGLGYYELHINGDKVGDLKHVSASVKTIRGMVSSSWTRRDSSLVLNVTLPVNSQAGVSVPKMGLKSVIVKESGRRIWKDGSYVEGVAGIIGGDEDEDYMTFDVGSGLYSFEVSGE